MALIRKHYEILLYFTDGYCDKAMSVLMATATLPLAFTVKPAPLGIRLVALIAQMIWFLPVMVLLLPFMVLSMIGAMVEMAVRGDM